jgi:hypothetical protein
MGCDVRGSLVDALSCEHVFGNLRRVGQQKARPVAKWWANIWLPYWDTRQRRFIYLDEEPAGGGWSVSWAWGKDTEYRKHTFADEAQARAWVAELKQLAADSSEWHGGELTPRP